MRKRMAISALLVVLAVPINLHGQALTAYEPAHLDAGKFDGVWRGRFDGLPGVDLVIADDGEQLHGAILFYLHQRTDVNSPYISKAGLPEPMFNLRLDGDALTFEVSHRHAHPPATLRDAPMKFRLRFIGPDQAQLVNESDAAPEVVMKRTGD